MPKLRSPDRDKAKEIYLQSEGTIKLRDLAEQLGVPEKTISAWKSKDRWDGSPNGVLRKNKTYSKQLRKANKEAVKSVQKNESLTDQQREFCLHYVQIFNQTQAAIRAGYSPHTAYSIGYNLMHTPAVREEINRLKAIKAEAILAGPDDIVERYMHIAFGNICDYVTFGQRQVDVMGPFGPIYEGKGKNKKKIQKIINYVDLHESAAVDASIISEVSQGKEGVKIKLLDSMKAMEWLREYFDMNPSDKRKQDYNDKKLALQERIVKVQEQRANSDDDIEDMTGIRNEVFGNEKNKDA